jgi:UDP:flavonoid glycosyltransferase YjiC (YdhE family)
VRHRAGAGAGFAHPNLVRILYAVCGWGLGHATRSLPVLRRLVAAHDVFLYAEGPARALLDSELPAGAVHFVGAVPYPNIFTGTLAFGFFAHAAGLVRAMRAEHAETEALVAAERIDRVVSDSRWGVSSRRVPSLFISHHLRQLAPAGLRAAERLTEAVTWRAVHARYRRILVPDVAADGGLSGRLAHELRFYRADEVRYVGPLSDVTRQPVDPSVDTLVLLSGPEPSRTRLEQRLIAGLTKLPGRTVVLRGIPGRRLGWPLPRIEARPHALKPERDRLFSAARVIVARSGYSTVMDAARVGVRALFVPMRGQTEQEYLARRLAERGLAHGVAERRLDLARDVAIAASRPGLGPLAALDGANAVDRVLGEIFG